jgi:phage major head subunit gpT-like protein
VTKGCSLGVKPTIMVVPPKLESAALVLSKALTLDKGATNK